MITSEDKERLHARSVEMRDRLVSSLSRLSDIDKAKLALELLRSMSEDSRSRLISVSRNKTCEAAIADCIEHQF
jgi:hypothetical protein